MGDPCTRCRSLTAVRTGAPLVNVVSCKDVDLSTQTRVSPKSAVRTRRSREREPWRGCLSLSFPLSFFLSPLLSLLTSTLCMDLFLSSVQPEVSFPSVCSLASQKEGCSCVSPRLGFAFSFFFLRRAACCWSVCVSTAQFDSSSVITYDDVGGLKKELTLIRELVELPLRFPEIFKQVHESLRRRSGEVVEREENVVARKRKTRGTPRKERRKR